MVTRSVIHIHMTLHMCISIMVLHYSVYVHVNTWILKCWIAIYVVCTKCELYTKVTSEQVTYRKINHSDTTHTITVYSIHMHGVMYAACETRTEANQSPVSEVGQHDGGYLLWTHPRKPEKRPHPLVRRE